MLKAILAVLLLSSAVSAQTLPMGEDLVPASAATDVAKETGSWQSPSTWVDGTVPAHGEKVYIPVGITVTNHATTADCRWIHIAGSLKCCDHCDTQINAHTIYIPMSGSLNLGMALMRTTGKCVVETVPGTFLEGDFRQLSGGIICHGTLMAAGKYKTEWSAVSDTSLAVGATSFTVPVAEGWEIGDKLVINGTDSMVENADNTGLNNRYQTEFVTVTGTLATSSGTVVSFSPPLQYRHFRWRNDKPFHVGNLTRNVIFRSRNPGTLAHRGHIMTMSSMVQLYHCAFEGLGRTDGSRVVTDPRLDVYGNVIAGSTDNPRARYPLHAHKVGQLSVPQLWVGCVGVGSPKWIFVNHDSNVLCKNCVATGAYGAAFATEEGQERGTFDHCLAVYNRGLGDAVASSDEDHTRTEAGDHGIAGDGFWLQGGMVAVTNCVASDNSGRGFALFNVPLNGWPRALYNLHPYLLFPIEVHGSQLPIEYAGKTSVPSGAVPQRIFDGNTAYGNKLGVQCWSSLPQDGSGITIWPLSVRGSIANLTLWGRGCTLHLEYAHQFNVDGVTIIGENGWRGRWGFMSTEATPIAMRGHHITIKNLDITGFSNKNIYPAPAPILSVGDNGIDPNHIIESTYPVTAYGYTRN